MQKIQAARPFSLVVVDSPASNWNLILTVIELRNNQSITSHQRIPSSPPSVAVVAVVVVVVDILKRLQASS